MPIDRAVRRRASVVTLTTDERGRALVFVRLPSRAADTLSSLRAYDEAGRRRFRADPGRRVLAAILARGGRRAVVATHSDDSRRIELWEDGAGAPRAARSCTGTLSRLAPLRDDGRHFVLAAAGSVTAYVTATLDVLYRVEMGAHGLFGLGAFGLGTFGISARGQVLTGADFPRMCVIDARGAVRLVLGDAVAFGGADGEQIVPSAPGWYQGAHAHANLAGAHILFAVGATCPGDGMVCRVESWRGAMPRVDAVTGRA